jgi:glucose/mannose transport system substrate-binding protein
VVRCRGCGSYRARIERVRRRDADQRHDKHQAARGRVLVDIRSEAAALRVLFATFRRSNPSVRAINAAVPGGAGSNAIVELAKRLQHHDPPDVWQTFAGKSVQAYSSTGVVRSVESIFAREGLRARMNLTILKALMHDGRPSGFPTGARRSNVLWFNKKMLEHAGVSAPSSGYTVAAFLADLEKVKAPGGTPLASAAGIPSPRSSCSRTRC